jgi:hypothetical protein
VPSVGRDGVTGLGGYGDDAQNPSKNDQKTDVFLTFDLTVRSPSLRIPPYSEYQQFLYDTIISLQEKGFNFQQVADWLNDNDYQTLRGNTFRNNNVHSIRSNTTATDSYREKETTRTVKRTVLGSFTTGTEVCGAAPQEPTRTVCLSSNSSQNFLV